ncbi:YbfB/YjiJ family MFS transporter [Acinetobacter sp. A47]|uniref:YbfB/YjiJ family MFS transporter n=1 Tax=Acinetobacter sp. A47 TaxID=1561217 RepID=UPI00056DB64B|nr:YbfB/YjiJ family MFS transporter [Acinetobacter sp. A47]
MFRPNAVTSTRQPMLRSAYSAALVMAIGMGFGRFAFTAVYPHMIEEGILDLHRAGVAASANYAGYLLGALLAIRLRSHSSYAGCVIATAGSILCLFFLSQTDSGLLIIVIRALAGGFSALAMISASLWLLEYQKQTRQAPVLYAGVGLGIALSAELLVFGTQQGWHSKSLWLWLAASGLVLGLAALAGISTSQPQSVGTSSMTQASTQTPQALPLILIYALAGFGYIITATYLPLLVKLALPESDAAHIWAIFGLGAIPSCFFWHYFHSKLGTRVALSANLGLQALGVIFPLLVPNTLGYLLSAFMVGGTFMGTVTIAMPVAQRIARHRHSHLVASMTVVYGLGQIIGPVVANTLFSISHTLDRSLIIAAIALLIATLICLKSVRSVH